MTVTDFLRSIPKRGLSDSLGDARVGLRRRTNWLDSRSTNIYDRDWDVLCILDACRVDLLDSVADGYTFLNDRDTIYSVGGTSAEWMEKTFSSDAAELPSTAYITGNPNTHNSLPSRDEFGLLDEVWRYGWDDDAGTILPRTLTDRAITVARQNDFERLIIHYMQPHVPFLDESGLTSNMAHPDVVQTDPDGKGETVWNRLQRGELSVSDIWGPYQDNLRCVLDDVALLRKNIDAETVAITADHGNAMGGLGQYGHGSDCLVDGCVRVPWVETDATDTESYVPSQISTGGEDTSVEDRLKDLGYL